MDELTFLDLAVLSKLSRLPPFKGLQPEANNTRLLGLNYLGAVFRTLRNLKRMDLVPLTAFAVLSDMPPLRYFEKFAAVRIMQLCCNGFVSRHNLTQPFCTANTLARIHQLSCV